MDAVVVVLNDVCAIPKGWGERRKGYNDHESLNG